MGEHTRPENDRYLIDEKELVWYNPDSIKPVLTVLCILVSELLALVYDAGTFNVPTSYQ